MPPTPDQRAAPAPIAFPLAGFPCLPPQDPEPQPPNPHTPPAWSTPAPAPLPAGPAHPSFEAFTATSTPRRPGKLLIGLAAAFALTIALVAWIRSSATPSEPQRTSSSAEDIAALQKLLPGGYQPDSCTPTAPPAGARATLVCGPNAGPEAPLTATYTLAANTDGLQRLFADSIRKLKVVICPGDIQSPGPWRRNADLKQKAGTLACAIGNDDTAVVVWTDETRLLLSQTHAPGPAAVSLPKLYRWWSKY